MRLFAYIMGLILPLLTVSFVAACNSGGSNLVVPKAQQTNQENTLKDDDLREENRIPGRGAEEDDDTKSPKSAFPGSRVTDISEDSDFDDEDFLDPSEERSQDSDCKFFTSSASLPLTETPPRFFNAATVIDHYPPAEYPMPVHETFDGEWQGDSYTFLAMVDIKISYRAADPYHSKWKTALPDSEEDPLYERRYYSVTIENADSSDCSVTYTKDER